jgi:hypothetical protein
MNDRDEARRRHFADPAVESTDSKPKPAKKKAKKKVSKKKVTKK